VRREDYVSAIYRFIEAGLEARLSDVARELGVTPPTAAKTLSRLEDEGYVVKRGATYLLTRKGLEVALRVIRNHRVIEKFLVEVLGVDVGEVHELAHRLEHVDEFAELLDRHLAKPDRCPHGNPIPDRGVETRATPLSFVREGDYIVERICELGKALEYARRWRLDVGDRVRVVAATEHALQLQLGSRVVMMPLDVARLIFVRRCGADVHAS